jgi:hypothetical protein
VFKFDSKQTDEIVKI